MNQTPVQAAVKVIRRTMAVPSTQHAEVIDITAEMQHHVMRAEVDDGLLVVNSLHTTCCLLVTELHASLIDRIQTFIQTLVPDELRYRHNDPRSSDCERGNAAAHLRACLLNQTVAVGIENRTLSLGPRQSVVFVEWDGPRSRSVDLHIVGTERER